jgi:hypothetical protein
MWFPHWDNASQINYDQVSLYEGRHKYRIDQRYLIDRTVIDIWEVDAEHHLIKEKGKTFFYQKLLFDYPKTNHDRIINRIKTILTFQ